MRNFMKISLNCRIIADHKKHKIISCLYKLYSYNTVYQDFNQSYFLLVLAKLHKSHRKINYPRASKTAIIRKLTFLISGSQWKNQPKSEDFKGLQLVFYTLNLHEIKRKCKYKLTFTFITDKECCLFLPTFPHFFITSADYQF